MIEPAAPPAVRDGRRQGQASSSIESRQDDRLRMNRGPSTPRTTLADNRRLVLSALRSSTELTRAEIEKLTGLSPAATARITRQLEQQRLIARSSQAVPEKGRPAWRYKFTAEDRFVSGIRVQADACHGVLLRWTGEVATRCDVGLSDDRSADAYLAAAIQCIDTLDRSGRRLGHSPVAIGVSVPSVVEIDGTLGQGPEIPWTGLPLRQLLTVHTGLPVVVENDANVLASSERENHVSLVALLLGYGLGAGIISDGHLLRGAHGLAGEIGYLPTSRLAFTAPVSVWGDLEARIRQVMGGRNVSSLASLWDCLISEKAEDRAKAAEMIDYLAFAVASLVAVVDPERVVLGDVPPAYGPLVVQELSQRLTGHLPQRPTISTARLGQDAVVVGAALMATEVVDLQAL